MKLFTKTTKTTQSVFSSFTAALEEIQERQTYEVSKETAIIEESLERKETAEAEVSIATNAIGNIMKMLKGDQ